MTINKSKILEKFVNITLNILIILFSIILLISFYTSFQVKVLKHKYSNFFGYTLFEVQTPSMEDAISAGDWIIVKLTNDVKLKDVVTYELNGEFITHRVVEIYNGTYITKGDANTGKDEPVDQTQLVGKVTKVLGGFGILKKTLFNPLVLIFLIISFYLFNSIIKKENHENKVDIKIKSCFKTILNKFKQKKKEENNITDLSKDNSVIQAIELDKILNRPTNYKPQPIDLPKLKAELVQTVENKKEEEIKAKTEEEIEEELSKTALYRVIPVDITDLDETILEIAQNELIEKIEEEVDKTLSATKKEEEQVEEPEEEVPSVDLELINNSIKKSNNIIEKMINIKKEETLELCYVFDDKVETNDPTIRSNLMDVYLNARYYNYYNVKELNYKGRKQTKKIENILEIEAKAINKKYEGSDKQFSRKVTEYLNIMKTITILNELYVTLNTNKERRTAYRDEIAKEFSWDSLKMQENITEILKIQKTYDDILKYSLKQLETDLFNLVYNKIVYRKNLFAVSLEHDISFNEVYSEYIIEKTYNEGIIAENKLQVLFSLLTTKLIEDMTNGDYDQKYIVYVPDTLYKKTRKSGRIFQMIDDEYAKSHIYILVDFEVFKSNQKQIKQLKKSGFRFALAINEDSKLHAKSRGLLEFVELIFINKKDPNYDNIISYIPKEIINKILYDDIFSKLEITEVEK